MSSKATSNEKFKGKLEEQRATTIKKDKKKGNFLLYKDRYMEYKGHEPVSKIKWGSVLDETSEHRCYWNFGDRT